MNNLQLLVNELVPAYAARIRLVEIPREDGKGYFLLKAEKKTLVITGSDRIAQAAGFHHYLKYYCRCQVSWSGNQLNIPEVMPLPEQEYLQVLPLVLRPYLNFCTYGYTTVWWDWNRWKKEIDLMALNGINLPLSVTGVEMVWYRTLLRMGLADLEARSFISGPAFLPWQWMVNMDSHAGPIPREWLDSHLELGRQIVAYQRAWGMKAILPGFSGHVPAVWAQRHPGAKIIVGQEGWGNFPPIHLLDPTDAKFGEVMSIYMEELNAAFGTDHYYAMDLFHEQELPNQDPDYPQRCGEQTAARLLNIDPKAVWVMQAWSERQGIIEAIPKGHLLMLDIGKNRLKATEGLYGVPTVWGCINNFGGQTKIQGHLNDIPKRVQELRASFPNLIGMGAFPENLTANPVFFDLMFEQALTDKPIRVEEWTRGYAVRRYGTDHPAALEAWALLLRDGYGQSRGDILFDARPSLHVEKGNAWIELAGVDEANLFFPIWGKLLEAGIAAGGAEGYRFDLVDVGRQALGSLALPVYRRLTAAYFAKELAAFDSAAADLVKLMEDCDELLGCRDEFRLDSWVGEARRWGDTSALKAYYEYNARLQITLWGPEADPQPLFDYCCREWNGLIREYYLPRWTLFIGMLREKLLAGEAYDDARIAQSLGRPALQANAFYRKMLDGERAFVGHDSSDESLGKKGDLLEVATRLYAHYEARRLGWLAGCKEAMPRGRNAMLNN